MFNAAHRGVPLRASVGSLGVISRGEAKFRHSRDFFISRVTSIMNKIAFVSVGTFVSQHKLHTRSRFEISRFEIHCRVFILISRVFSIMNKIASSAVWAFSCLYKWQTRTGFIQRVAGHVAEFISAVCEVAAASIGTCAQFLKLDAHFRFEFVAKDRLIELEELHLLFFE